MQKFFIWLASFFIIFINCLNVYSLDMSPLNQVPISHHGRFIPLRVYARIWTNEVFNTHHLPYLPEELLLKLHFLGSESFTKTPLFSLSSTLTKKFPNLFSSNQISLQELKSILYEDSKKSLELLSLLILSKYQELHVQNNSQEFIGHKKVELNSLAKGLWVKNFNEDLKILKTPEAPPWNFLKVMQNVGRIAPINNLDKGVSEKILALFASFQEMNSLTIQPNAIELEFLKFYQELKEKKFPPHQIKSLLENRFPLETRLVSTGSTFLALPNHYENKSWYSLKALNLKIYDPTSNELIAIPNFTSYPDIIFKKIQMAYQALEQAFHTNIDQGEAESLAEALIEGYLTLKDTSYQRSMEKALIFPSLTKLKIENFYYTVPFIFLLFVGYLISIFFLVLARTYQNRPICYLAIFFSLSTFLIHTTNLLLRCYILSRPPVSNMAETALFVPWIAVIASFILFLLYRSLSPLLGAFFSACSLMVILKFSEINLSLENVQAVLDSRYWLTIHVLLVVGSYGIFIISGFLGHYYLIINSLINFSQRKLDHIGQVILQSMYMGLALLIPGTILGGVWAAQSWGRFWDWDPKESWAFISCCIYLLCIHAHYFRLITTFGLAIGAVLGLIVIGFTWYGVNYILGTGLHSYGFGSGGESFFYSYVLTEIFFLVLILFLRYNRGPSRSTQQ